MEKNAGDLKKSTVKKNTEKNILRGTLIPPRMKRELLIASGVDPSGAAGLAVDIATAHDFNVDPAIFVTAFTIQSGRSIHRVEPREASHAKAELKYLLGEFRPRIMKIGMIPDENTVKIVSSSLQIVPRITKIVDPILCSSSGKALISTKGFNALLSTLLPGAILTPNLVEAEIISRQKILSDKDREAAAQRILNMGAFAVIIKGGHDSTDRADDLLASRNDFIWIRGKARRSANGRRVQLRGTGCRFSTAFACSLIHGLDLEKSARLAKRFVRDALTKSDLESQVLPHFIQRHGRQAPGRRRK
ncbi:MAG: hydroxymethylpyrimidine/phosphomethylpyrimidine kinase [Candidatus Hydrogenedentota bacterium]